VKLKQNFEMQSYQKTSMANGKHALEQTFANFRDLGGMKTACHHMVRYRRLLRSSALVQISVQKADFLVGTLGDCIYFDLRTDREVDRDGGADALVDRGWQWLRIPIQDERDEQIPPLERHLQTLPQYQKAARCVIQEMSRPANEHRPGIVACSLGKDRTGLVIALMLHWLGIASSDIAKDFVLSNKCLVEQRCLLPLRWRDPQHNFNIVTVNECLDVIGASNGELMPPKFHCHLLKPFDRSRSTKLTEET
jgi:hypothetical protein